MSFQMTVWEDQQLVNQPEIQGFTNDIYQRLGVLEPIKPFILNGLEVSINGSGLVTVTAGNAISPDMNNSDNPEVPGNGLEVIGALVSQQTVQDTASGTEFGIVVLRQSLTPIPTTPNFTITSTLVYIAGSSTTYPAPLANDVPLIGIYHTGGAYTLDYGQRAVTTQTYEQSVQGLEYFTNTDFYKWTLGTTFTVGTSAVPVCDDWLAYSNTAGTIVVQQYAMSSSERQVVPNSPLYATQIVRSVAGSGSPDILEQLITPYWTLNGKVLTVSYWAKASASGSLTGNVTVYYNPQGASEIALPYISPSQTIATDGTFRLYTFTIGINDITDALGSDHDNYIVVKLGFNGGTGTYTATIAESHLTGGAAYIQPQYQRGQDFGIATGTQEMGWWPATNVGLGYIPLVEGTIGSLASGATIRASMDCAQLYCLLWNSTAANPTYAAVSGGRGSSAQDDFVANKTIALIRNAGMVFANAGTASTDNGVTTSTNAFGFPTGEESHVQTSDEVADHTHGYNFPSNPNANCQSASASVPVWRSASTEVLQTTSAGTGTAMAWLQPTTYVTYRIKL